jgi:SAM-dependent methyltransferase
MDEAGLSLPPHSGEGDRLRDGVLSCTHCGTEYQIRDGIPHLLAGGGATLVGERRAYRRSRPKLLDEWGSDRDGLLGIARMEHTSEEFRRSSALNLELLWDSLDPRPGELVVELGAGSCLHTAELARRGCVCVAVDISTDLKLELGELVAHAAGVTIDCVVGDMGNLPFRSGTVGVVFSTASLHHGSSLEATLSEAARVLGPGGRFGAASEPMHGLLTWWSVAECRRGMEELPGSHEASYTYSQWVSAMRGAGLDPSFMWPPYYDYLLRRGTSGTKFGRLGRMLGLLWRFPGVRGVVTGPLFRWLQLAVGINVVVVARRYSAALAPPAGSKQ